MEEMVVVMVPIAMPICRMLRYRVISPVWRQSASVSELTACPVANRTVIVSRETISAADDS
jgi:hypothetical protein